MSPDQESPDLEILYFKLYDVIYGQEGGLDRNFPENFAETHPTEFALMQDTLMALMIEGRGYHAPSFTLGMLYRDAGQYVLAEVLMIAAGLALRSEAGEDDEYEEDECWEIVASIALDRGNMHTARLAIRQLRDPTLRGTLEERLIATRRSAGEES